MVSFNSIRLAVAAMCVGQAVLAAPVGDTSVAPADVDKRWNPLWIIFPQQYEDAVDENGNPTLSDAAFDLSKVDSTQLGDAIKAANAKNAQTAARK